MSRQEPVHNMCFLSILAEASLEHTHEAKRARSLDPPPAGGAIPGAAHPGSPVSMLKCSESECSEITTASECTTRCPSPTPANPARPRSTSPNSGKSFMCNKCSRTYASTDAVRKHARQNHPEWLKERGLGCTSLYCTPVDAAATAVHGVVAANLHTDFNKEVAIVKPVVASAAPVAAVPVTASPVKPTVVAVAAPIPNLPAPKITVTLPAETTTVAVTVPPSPADPAAALLLMTAAESGHRLTMAAHADDDETDEHDDRFAAFLASRQLDLWSAPVQRGAPASARKPPRTGMKRPRTVRCGNCDGCVRSECGMCKNCVDMPRFGGPGGRKQGCVRKACSQPRVAPQA